jgi:uncharacterized protein YycO
MPRFRPYRKAAVAELRPSDVIVSTTDHPTSALIRASIGCDVSHSMLYIGGDWIIDALSDGVHSRSATMVLEGSSLAILLRRVNTTESQRAAVVENALKYQNRPYDHIAAAGSGLTGRRGAVIAGGAMVGCRIQPLLCGGAPIFAEQVLRNAQADRRDDAFFCSELVARAFELAGVPIVDGSPSFTHPRHIRVSPYLRYVGHLKGGPG